MVTLRRVRTVDPPSLLARPRDTDRPAALTSRRKRLTDIAVALVLLVLSSPVWLVAAVLIKVSSSGPIFFRQTRIGTDGNEFVCFKFRTMHMGGSDAAHRELVSRMIRGETVEAAEGEPYKLKNDARVIRGVGWLRRTSLDELPQLINVLRGEMSMVGPRPPLPYEVELYQPWQLQRLAVRPGITGLWQVSGRNRLTYNEMCDLDRRYIEGWSYSRDLAIMARTPWVMFIDGGGAS